MVFEKLKVKIETHKRICRQLNDKIDSCIKLNIDESEELLVLTVALKGSLKNLEEELEETLGKVG